MTSVAAPMHSKRVRSGIAGKNVLFVGGIPRCATQKTLRGLFNDLTGDVVKVRFVMDMRTRCHQGYGFVRFGSAKSAAKVLAMASENNGNVEFKKGKLLQVGSTERLPAVRNTVHSRSGSSDESTMSTSAPSSPLSLTRTWQPYQDVDVDSADVCYTQPCGAVTRAMPVDSVPATTLGWSAY